MRNPELKAFILQHSDLFWYSPEDKKEEIGNEFHVETILNYGDLNAVIELFRILGINNVAEIFFNSINRGKRKKINYHEITVNYFTLLFKRYAQANN